MFWFNLPDIDEAIVRHALATTALLNITHRVEAGLTRLPDSQLSGERLAARSRQRGGRSAKRKQPQTESAR